MESRQRNWACRIGTRFGLHLPLAWNQGKTYLFVVGSNLSGLKTSGSAKCSGIWHIVPVGIWKKNPIIMLALILTSTWDFLIAERPKGPFYTTGYTIYTEANSSAYSDMSALWDVVATNFNSTWARAPSNPPDWWVHTESFKENLQIQQICML